MEFTFILNRVNFVSHPAEGLLTLHIWPLWVMLDVGEAWLIEAYALRFIFFSSPRSGGGKWAKDERGEQEVMNNQPQNKDLLYALW